ncbi:MAG: alpha/beta hydrolase [Acinetobacter populi]|jgi:pimeloyl-ACP methyl ester carboxylesterase|uniref:lipase family alpha/beta hydrolase n=1 Tax=Acinetobacter populi TaxID=1582270 RepID=UPI00235784AF|nr:alpha/beta hydrolase [Acinetobacter populi]MCH4246514.1 alpha/beta hydrolase [Acinetobacter populi]
MLKILTLTLGMSLSIGILSGCQVVSVKQQKLGTSLSNERDNILTRNKLSEASLNVLSMTGQQANKCINQPETCMNELRQITEIQDEQLLSTGSEVYLANAIELKQSKECNPKNIVVKFKDENEKLQIQEKLDQCLNQQLESLNQSIRYSYAYLFSTKRPPAQRLFDNRQVQVRDFYNQAIANLVNAFNDSRQSDHTDYNSTLKMGNSDYRIDITQYPNLDSLHLEKLISTYNLGFSGLRSISRRDGFGSEFTLQMAKPDTKQFDQYLVNPFIQSKNISDHPNIVEARFLAATIVVEPSQRGSVDEILNSKTFNLHLIDPNFYQNIEIAHQNFPLAANFSAPYGLWLANDNLGAAAYWTLIDREQNLIMPHLFMLEPYNPNKKVIVMIHGLASSPEAWIAMTNDIMGDSVLRDNYQVWQIFYSTNMPIIESRYQIYALLKQAFDDLAVKYPSKPPQHAVLLGHSMGGVISRLLVSDDDFTPQILSYLQKNNLRKYERVKNFGPAQDRLAMHALTPPIDRAIFVSSPFRGTDFADRWFTLAARKIIKLPQSFLTASFETISHGLSGDLTTDYLKQFGKDFLQNGPSDLSKKSAFMQITANTKISPKVKYHVIMGNDTNSNDIKTITDGIVPYYSAHLDGAQSEKIIHGGHSIQYSPEAVLELRRILRLHLQELGRIEK